MSKVIEFNQAIRLRRELEEREEEVRSLKEKLAATVGVNEMLKFQILDLLDQMKSLQSQFQTIEQNLLNLQSKLPDLD